MDYENFFKLGFVNEFNVEINKEITLLQQKIYDLTQNIIIDHDTNLNLIEKIKLPFKEIPSEKIWSELMNEINSSNELKNLINSKGIYSVFKNIFKNPEIFEICTFRARIPNQKRVIYNWHQDEGTWFLSKNKKINNKFSATMWLSINGSNYNNSIQLVKGSHNGKLFNHSYVDGQGYFKAENLNIINNSNIYNVKTSPSQAVLFHPLTLHRSVPNAQDKPDMYPRYSVDIRYYDKSSKLDYKTTLLFKLKKLIKKL